MQSLQNCYEDLGFCPEKEWESLKSSDDNILWFILFKYHLVARCEETSGEQRWEGFTEEAEPGWWTENSTEKRASGLENLEQGVCMWQTWGRRVGGGEGFLVARRRDLAQGSELPPKSCGAL